MTSKLFTFVLLSFYALSQPLSIKASDTPFEEKVSRKVKSSPVSDDAHKDSEKKKDSSEKSRKTRKKEAATIIAAVPATFENLLGSSLKSEALKTSAKPAFTPPTEIGIKDIILLFSAGYDPKTSTFNKIYLAQDGVSCNVISPIIGDEFEKLEKRLFLKEFRDNTHVKTLVKYFTVTDPSKPVKVTFDTDEFSEISKAKSVLNTLLGDSTHRLSQIVLRTCHDDESRAVSTIAAHNSISTTYELYKKYKDGELVPFGKFKISLNFYRHA